MIAAVSTPLNTILLANLLQSMVDYGISLVIGSPANDEFLRAMAEFAIYNSILGAGLVLFTYIATVLMNISAYNQVNITNT